MLRFQLLKKGPEPMANDITKPLGLVAAGYAVQLKEHGATPMGVLWSDKEGQELRFRILMELIEADINNGGLTINDLGCGYGAFFEFLKDMPLLEGGHYYGFDICDDMVEAAKQRISDPRAVFMESSFATQKADYSFASGTFNMKGTEPDKDWSQYVKESLRQLFSQSAKGMAFNILDSRQSERQEWLYYADPEELLDYCRSTPSPKVKLIDGYPLKEATILVGK